MSGSGQDPTAQSNIKITSIHTLLCRFQGHYYVMEVKFMVGCTSMKVCYHKSIPLIMSKIGKLYDYITLGFRLSALVEKCSIFRCFVLVQLWKILNGRSYVPPYIKGVVRLKEV
jgi:hypothetical protein